eukprot:CAMPEP_0117011006 /NCGR_PEP_ID=MMETSP0472-20121206/9557_1 /TAXON_ID=693140 ORGANISM="Tiarina fusus, Strain LIS" /NCGR_SAMPLE_ID=MMETSP0472 /ASSEMBLY_ACC=CAM_ASM_000603 /LENGTH=433 /DNA_ID=CAMNT_0004713685 /DNA_START=377 /DNA_END=1675 /DNA_ORIENTATION=+
MPIFRIMGGSNNNSRSSNNLAGNNNTQQQQQPQQPCQPHQQPTSQRVSRNTYPGHRISSSNPAAASVPNFPHHLSSNFSASMPQQPPRVGGSMARNAANMALNQGHQGSGSTVVRGSSVKPQAPKRAALEPTPSPELRPDQHKSIVSLFHPAFDPVRSSPSMPVLGECGFDVPPARVRDIPSDHVAAGTHHAQPTFKGGHPDGVRRPRRTIPPNIYPGMQFTVNVSGQRFMVTCPQNAGPNMKVRIVPPTQREEPMAAPKTQVFEVTVPAGVRPNQPFTLMANGQRVLVTCPPNVVPGQKIRFQLPVSQVIGSIQLSYESESGGWCRTIRVTDLKFQWVRVNQKTTEGTNVDDMTTFDFSKSAYVRKVNYLEGNDARMRTGSVELAPANEAVVDSRLLHCNRTLLSYADIANVQGKPLEEKTTWFQNICSQPT